MISQTFQLCKILGGVFWKKFDFTNSYIIMSLKLRNNNIAMYINSINKHWKKDFFYDISFKRDYFERLLPKLDDKFITNLVWIRRVWKTTLMKQFIDYLIQEKGVGRKNIFFYSFDELWEIREKIEEYKKITEVDLDKEKVYIFLDEIQKVRDWQSKVKIYYDLYPNVKFILSGSSSLFLQKKESLAGRIFEYYIKPLSFWEFLRYKKIEHYLEDKNIYKDEIILEFEKYVFRQFIDVINFSNEEVYEYMNWLVNKIIKEDISAYFRIDFPDVLLRVFKIISSNPWMILDYKNFANDLDIDQRTLEKYIYYLEEAFLLKKVYNYSANLIKTERKLKKVYLESTSFCLNQKMDWEVFENYILNCLDLEYFYRVWNKEVDFILPWDKYALKPELVWLEIKYKSKIKKSDTRGLRHFDKKYWLKRQVIVSKDFGWVVEGVEVLPFWEVGGEKFL